MFSFLVRLPLKEICSYIFLLFQESGRHAEALGAITNYLDMGTYSEWDEVKKLDFLTRELKGKRPLVPPSIEVSLELHSVSHYCKKKEI